MNSALIFGGLLALMLLQDSRRDARLSPEGELVLLADQDRTLWDRQAIDEGLRMLARAEAQRRPGSYQLQAAIAAGPAPTAGVPATSLGPRADHCRGGGHAASRPFGFRVSAQALLPRRASFPFR